MRGETLLKMQCQVSNMIGRMHLDGELIAESRYEPERVLREWLELDVCRVIIAMDRVTHIDSAGFSTLLAALHRCRRQDGDLLLVGLNPSLNAIFEVASMERYFKIFPDLDAAIRHFEQQPLNT